MDARTTDPLAAVAQMTKPISGPAPAKSNMIQPYNTVEAIPCHESDLLTRLHLDNARDVHRLIESRSNLSPYQDRELAVKILNKLLSYHTDIIEKLIEEGKAEFVVA